MVLSLVYFFHIFFIFLLLLTASEYQSDVLMGLPMINNKYLNFKVLIVNQEPVVMCIE